MTTMNKVSDFRRKMYNGTVTVKVGDEGGQLLSARVSTIDRDRDGEVILPGGIDYRRYRANPILMWQHKLDIPAVGKCIEIGADSRGLNCRFQFAPTALGKELFSLYSGGYLRAFSISFAPLDFDRPTATHRSIELYEISAVNLPSNPQALVQAIGKGLVISSALRKDLGLKDEITIEDEPDITIEESPEDYRKIIQEKVSATLAEMQAHLVSEEGKKEITITDTDIKSADEIDVTPEELDRMVQKVLKEQVEVAIAKLRGRVI